MCMTGQYIWLPCYINVTQLVFLIFSITGSFLDGLHMKADLNNGKNKAAKVSTHEKYTEASKEDAQTDKGR